MNNRSNEAVWSVESSIVLKFFSGMILCAVAGVLFWGCGENSTGTGDLFGSISPGSFEAQVSGSESQSFSGISLFGVQQVGEPVGNIFVLTLSSTTNNPNYSITVTFRRSNRPGSGEHAITGYDSDRAGQFVVFRSQTDTRVYRSLNGEMVITGSSAERLQGELTFSAALSSNSETTVNVRAKFNANCHQASMLSCD